MSVEPAQDKDGNETGGYIVFIGDGDAQAHFLGEYPTHEEATLVYNGVALAISAIINAVECRNSVCSNDDSDCVCGHGPHCNP